MTKIPYTEVWFIRAAGGWAAGQAGFPHAVMTAYFEGKKGDFIPVQAEVDTGADVTVLPSSLAYQLKQYSPPRQITMKQVQGMVPATMFDAKIAIMQKSYIAPVIVLEGYPTPLIGRTGLLDNFQVVMDRDSFELVPSSY